MDLRDKLQTVLRETFTIQHELSGGGMSRVFVAEEIALGRQVVIKVLSPALAAGVSVERFKQEIRLAARLQHPHIVPVLSAGEVDGLPYYTMPLVKGESLRARVSREHELPIADTIRILRDVAAALAYAHADGVVHRDIKPDNVMLTGGAAVLTDLGVGKAMDVASTNQNLATGSGLTSVGVALGTPAYMAPEQAAADPGVDHRADIYSFGCMAYELLAGATPFAARTPQQLFAAHMTEPPEPIAARRSSAPQALAELVMQCLAKRPADRPQRAADLLKSLEQLASTGAHPVAADTSPVNLQRALMFYFAAAFAVVAIAYGATEVIGLPDWVPPGAIIVMALGLPVVLFTAWAQNRRGSAAKYATWGRTTVGGFAAVGALALLVIAYMASRALGVGPAASLEASGKVDKNQRVIVAEFAARGVDSTLAVIAAEAVRTDLSQSTSLIPVAHSEVEKLLQLALLPDTANVTVTVARNIALRDGIRAVVTGDITPIKDGLIVALKLLESETGNELASFRETIKSESEIIASLGRLSRKLRGKAGESLRRVRWTPPLDRVTTASLEALREYIAGARANDNRRYTVAITHLESAVAKDTLFASAWRLLGVTRSNAALAREQIDAPLAKAYELRSRLSEIERYRTETSYFQLGPGRNRAAAAKIFDQWLQKDSLSLMQSGMANYPSLLNTRREFARAESLLLRTKAAGYWRSLLNAPLVSAQYNQGKLAEAEKTVAEARATSPDAVTPMAWEIGFLHYRGQYDSAQAVLRKLQSQRTGAQRNSATNGLRNYALLFGRLREGARLNEESRTSRTERGRGPGFWAAAIWNAQEEIWFRDRPEIGLRILDSALTVKPLSTEPPESRPYATLAMWYALANRPDKARALLQQRSVELTDTLVLRLNIPALQYAEAMVAMAERRTSDAVALLRKSDMLHDGPNGSCHFCIEADIGHAFYRGDMPDSALVHLERFVNTPYLTRYEMLIDGVFLAHSYRMLGELYDDKGDVVNARKYYGKFIELWAKADPELQPVVQQARARLEALAGEPQRRIRR